MKWQYEGDEREQAAQKQLRMAIGGDPTDPSSYLFMAAHPEMAEFFKTFNQGNGNGGAGGFPTSVFAKSPSLASPATNSAAVAPRLADVGALEASSGASNVGADVAGVASKIDSLAGGGSSSLGGVGGFLKKLAGYGIDPIALGLGALTSLVGNPGGPQQRQSYAGASPDAAKLVNPIQSLYNSLNAANNFGVSMNNMLANGMETPSSYVQAPPAPVSIPGLPFQIGGGLGTDPALKDPSLLTKQTGGDFYSSLFPNGATNMNGGGAPVPKRRSPGGNG